MGSTLVILAAFGAVAFWAIRNRKAAPAAPRRKPETSHARDTKFASVVLHCTGDTCQSALRLRDRPLLAAEAPALPLADCNKSTCGCSYRKAGDRRQIDDGRRTADVGITPLIYDGEEMRAKAADRRGD